MPPEGSPQPSDSERQHLVKQIRHELDTLIQQRTGDPGRVVMRRLTSAEYDYTIQDLTGLDLDLERQFVSDAVGGEGFTNIGDVQFIQDSSLERYLEAGKTVAAHAVIGSGPLQFFPDPGKTGRELSAIHRIQQIYRRHGFRTGAGEGAEPFGLDRYPKAFFAAWSFRHRHKLNLEDVTLAKLAASEQIDARFVEHVWTVLNEPSSSFPTSAIVEAWDALPEPNGPDTAFAKRVRSQCDRMYSLLRNWQRTLAATSVDEEEASVLTEGEIQVSPKHSFKADLRWPEKSTKAAVRLSINSASKRTATNQKKKSGSLVIWSKPHVRFRTDDQRWTKKQPLKNLLTENSLRRLSFGRHPLGAKLDSSEFVLSAGETVVIEFRVPQRTVAAQLFVDVELDLEHGQPGFVRCSIDDGEVEGETAAETGTTAALLTDPNAHAFASWKAGVMEFARKLPEVSHREPAPSDRDPIPAPFDNTYNTAERNMFHYVIKYHRDDRFLVTHILDDPTRRSLDQAWTDLLTSFEYHDAYLRFVGKKYKLDLPAHGVAGLDQDHIARLPTAPRKFVQRLRDDWVKTQRDLKSAGPTHVEDAIRFARLAWRRPLSDQEQNRLRSFYASLRKEAGLDHTKAVRALLARILVAPAFLYKVEVSLNQPGIVPLSDLELAGRLSYFLWASAPDAELRRVAAAGRLSDPKQLDAQTRRMLRDPKARRFATEFFGQSFGFYRFDGHRGVDVERFPEFTDSLKTAMYDEAVSFFEYIVRQDRPVQEILFADYSFLNRELAEHYGVKTQVELSDAPVLVADMKTFHRGGLLRLGAVLTATSAPLRTSPVKRSDWILRRVLGTPVPPPPPDAGSIPPDDVLADGLTLRQRLVAHRSDASCVNCHARFDPLGFALEHFDSVGRWRGKYRDGQVIDATGTLNDGTNIAGPAGLRRYLTVRQKGFYRTLCTKLLGYALGRGELLTDRPLIEQMMAGLEREERLSDLIIKIVASKQFGHRRGGAASRLEEKRDASADTKDSVKKDTNNDDR